MRVHFVGIGGIGISGLAKYLHYKGHQVSGSDISETKLTRQLQTMGIKVNIPHSKEAITDQDRVYHSAIIRPDNPEVVAARQKDIKVMARREALLEILDDKKVYAVAGAHGKSTTTAILASIMEGSAIIGAESKEFGSNVRYNEESEVLLFEADESDGSFLNANPYCAIVTNAEPEHMEYYDYNVELFYDHYRKFINKASLRVINAEDPFLSSYEGDALRLYPSKDIKNIEYVLINDEPHTRFSLKELGVFDVWGFGEHIAIDASLAIMAASQSMDTEEIRTKILNFKGIKKRFDILSKSDSGVMIDDYAHHPTEIKATLKSVMEYAKLKGIDKVTTIWQPHKYSRTLDNLDAFIECFDGTQELVILPVWAAGESVREIDFENSFNKYNLIMADKIRRHEASVNIVKDEKVLKSLDNGIVIGFGAGDITYQLRGAC